MTTKTATILSLILICLSSNSFATNTDTLLLYRKDCGMRYNVYKWHLFLIESPPKYAHTIKTAQDSLLINLDDESSYCIFYDRRNRKMFEGPLSKAMFKGTVSFYYNSGKLKKTQTYDVDTIQYANSTFAWTDAPYEMGTWKYYNRSGRIVKLKEFHTLIEVEQGITCFYRISIVSRIDRKGNINNKKTVLLNKYTTAKTQTF